MHVGASFIFQNPGKQQPDRAVWDEELAMVDLVEPLGFESVWATEHHITDYIMCPDPVQFLGLRRRPHRDGQVGNDGRRPAVARSVPRRVADRHARRHVGRARDLRHGPRRRPAASSKDSGCRWRKAGPASSKPPR